MRKRRIIYALIFVLTGLCMACGSTEHGQETRTTVAVSSELVRSVGGEAESAVSAGGNVWPETAHDFHRLGISPDGDAFGIALGRYGGEIEQTVSTSGNRLRPVVLQNPGAFVVSLWHPGIYGTTAAA